MSMFALSEGKGGAAKSPAVANPSVASCPYPGAPASTRPSVIADAQMCPPQRLAVHYLMNDARKACLIHVPVTLTCDVNPEWGEEQKEHKKRK